MADELGLTAAQDSLIAASFSAEQRSARRLLAWSTAAGLLAVAQGLSGSPTQLVAARFLLGVVESAVLPSLVTLLSRWFTKGERGRADTFLVLGKPDTVSWLSAVSGWRVSVSDRRVMFAVEGAPSVAWGCSAPRSSTIVRRTRVGRRPSSPSGRLPRSPRPPGPPAPGRRPSSTHACSGCGRCR